MSDRVRDAFTALLERMEPPPAWEEVTTPATIPTRRPRRPGPWTAVAVGLVTVLVIGVGTAFLTDTGPFATATVPYVRLTWSQEVEMRCVGMETVDNGGFDEAVIEIWGPTRDDLFRIDATAPDGTVVRTIVEMGDEWRPDRVWSSSEFRGGEGVFRETECTTSDGSGSYGVAQSPLFRFENFPMEYTGYPTTDWEGEPFDLESYLTGIQETRRETTWNGRPVTVYESSGSGTDELGTSSGGSEVWVDMEQRRNERYVELNDHEALARIRQVIEVVERAEVSLRDVSFNTDELILLMDFTDIGPSEEESVVTTTSIVPLEHPLMADAVAITAADIASEDLAAVIGAREGDRLYRVPVDGFELLVRLRPGVPAHVYATSCDVLISVDLPEAWEGTCLERTIDGERVTGEFSYQEAAGD